MVRLVVPKEADSLAGTAIKGREKKWADIGMVWSEVAGLCGVWDGSCESGTCGAGIVIQAFELPHARLYPIEIHWFL